jgi:hypothetical protein
MAEGKTDWGLLKISLGDLASKCRDSGKETESEMLVIMGRSENKY